MHNQQTPFLEPRSKFCGFEADKAQMEQNETFINAMPAATQEPDAELLKTSP